MKVRQVHQDGGPGLEIRPCPVVHLLGHDLRILGPEPEDHGVLNVAEDGSEHHGVDLGGELICHNQSEAVLPGLGEDVRDLARREVLKFVGEELEINPIFLRDVEPERESAGLSPSFPYFPFSPVLVLSCGCLNACRDRQADARLEQRRNRMAPKHRKILG